MRGAQARHPTPCTPVPPTVDQTTCHSNGAGVKPPVSGVRRRRTGHGARDTGHETSFHERYGPGNGGVNPPGA
jgi:hypothetical protein